MGIFCYTKRMEKFNSQKHSEYIKDLPFSYFSSIPYLDFMAYSFERNNEHLIVWQDIIYPHDFPSIFLPRNKSNWVNVSVAFVMPEEIEKIKSEKIEIKFTNTVVQEYFYKTDTLLNPKGKLGQRIRQFEKNYEYKIYNSYPLDKVNNFFEFWKRQREHDSLTFEEGEKHFVFLLDKLDQYDIKQVYIEVGGNLVGLAWGVKHQSGNWVGLHLKVNYEYKGLSRFLHQERAKLFKDYKLFTLGTGSHDSGITQFKEELGPSLIIDYQYVLTGDKIK